MSTRVPSGLAVSLLLAAALHRYVGHQLGAGEPVAWLLLISFGVIFSATLTPGARNVPSPIMGKASCASRSVGPLRQLPLRSARPA